MNLRIRKKNITHHCYRAIFSQGAYTNLSRKQHIKEIRSLPTRVRDWDRLLWMTRVFHGTESLKPGYQFKYNNITKVYKPFYMDRFRWTKDTRFKGHFSKLSKQRKSFVNMTPWWGRTFKLSASSHGVKYIKGGKNIEYPSSYTFKFNEEDNNENRV